MLLISLSTVLHLRELLPDDGLRVDGVLEEDVLGIMTRPYVNETTSSAGNITYMLLYSTTCLKNCPGPHDLTHLGHVAARTVTGQLRHRRRFLSHTHALPENPTYFIGTGDPLSADECSCLNIIPWACVRAKTYRENKGNNQTTSLGWKISLIITQT